MVTQHGKAQLSVEDVVKALNIYRKLMAMEEIRLQTTILCMAELPNEECFRVIKHKLIRLAAQDVLRIKNMISELEAGLASLLKKHESESQ